MKSLFLKTFCILGILFVYTASFAQTGGPDQIIQIKVSPQNPAPGETFTITAENYYYNLDQATIEWFVNGISQEKGVGKKSFVYNAPNNGSSLVIRTTIATREGIDIETSTNIVQNSVDMIFEPQTYTPSWYKGLARFTNEATARVIAMPNMIEGGVKLDPAQLTYKWRIDSGNQPDQSGYGENVFFFFGDIIGREKTVSVTVSSPSGKTISTGSILIQTTEPVLKFYENNPLFGLIKNISVNSNYSLRNEEVSFLAIPFFFSTESIESAEIGWLWRINGTQTEKRSPLITLRNDGGEGTSAISLQAEHVNKIVQAATKSINIEFGQ